MPEAEPYFSSNESGDEDDADMDLDNIPDADLLNPDSADLDAIYGRAPTSSSACSQPPQESLQADGNIKQSSLVLSTSPLLNEFHLMNLGVSTDDLGNLPTQPSHVEPAPVDTQEVHTNQRGWFRSLASYWRKEAQPNRGEQELARIQEELEQLKNKFSQFGEVYKEMEDEVKGYKSLLMSQLHAPPAHYQRLPVRDEIAAPIPLEPISSVPDESASALPPPPPPPPPPAPGLPSLAPSHKAAVKRAKTNGEREKQLFEIISDSDLHKSKHREAVLNYMHVLLDELKKEEILDKLIDHYPRLVQLCAATPRAAAMRMATWERLLFKKLTPQEINKERKNQEWFIGKLSTREEITSHITGVMAKIEAARKAEAEKRLKEQQSSKMTNVVEELKGLLQSRLVDAPVEDVGEAPADVDVTAEDLRLSGSI